jgi:hypothetical protein
VQGNPFASISPLFNQNLFGEKRKNSESPNNQEFASKHISALDSNSEVSQSNSFMSQLKISVNQAADSTPPSAFSRPNNNIDGFLNPQWKN